MFIKSMLCLCLCFNLNGLPPNANQPKKNSIPMKQFNTNEVKNTSKQDLPKNEIENSVVQMFHNYNNSISTVEESSNIIIINNNSNNNSIALPYMPKNIKVNNCLHKEGKCCFILSRVVQSGIVLSNVASVGLSFWMSTMNSSNVEQIKTASIVNGALITGSLMLNGLLSQMVIKIKTIDENLDV